MKQKINTYTNNKKQVELAAEQLAHILIQQIEIEKRLREQNGKSK